MIIREAAEEIGMPATISFAFEGTVAQFQTLLKGLGFLLVIAVTLIYLVLGVLYESSLHPTTILFGLPSAAIRALLTPVIYLYLHSLQRRRTRRVEGTPESLRQYALQNSAVE